MSSPHSAGRGLVHSHMWEEAEIFGAILEAGSQCSLKSDEFRKKIRMLIGNRSSIFS